MSEILMGIGYTLLAVSGIYLAAILTEINILLWDIRREIKRAVICGDTISLPLWI